MEASGMKGGAAVSAPNPAAALLALFAATDSLDAARERIARGDFTGGFSDSRNAIRFASSAVLLREGAICDSAEGVAHLLSIRFPGRFPIEDWLDIERMPDGDPPGLYNIILAAMGRLKKAGEQEAHHAFAVAESFVRAAASEMSL